jgi:hypothetical protein
VNKQLAVEKDDAHSKERNQLRESGTKNFLALSDISG